MITAAEALEITLKPITDALETCIRFKANEGKYEIEFPVPVNKCLEEYLIARGYTIFPTACDSCVVSWLPVKDIANG